MLRTVSLPGTDVVTTAAGLGCAGLFREPSRRQRRRLLEAAHGAGIRHFDVAPMYGLGLGERELGSFARGRRDEVVIATKFGIAPTPVARSLATVQAPLRRLLTRFSAVGRVARSTAAGPTSGRAGALLYSATGFDAAAARASLEGSLREMGTDYVDLLLLHDPQPDAVRADDVCAYLEEARSAGHIRAWGIAGEPDPTLRVADKLAVWVPVLQVRADALARKGSNVPAGSFGARITFGVLGRAVAHIAADLASRPERRRHWQEALRCERLDSDVVVSLVLRQAARDNPDGVVLFSTTREDHLRLAVGALSTGRTHEDADLDAFEGLMDTVRRDDAERTVATR